MESNIQGRPHSKLMKKKKMVHPALCDLRLFSLRFAAVVSSDSVHAASIHLFYNASTKLLIAF